MRVTREDFESGWADISIGIARKEIDRFIAMIETLKQEPAQHFHICGRCQDDSRIADIEIYLQGETEPDNADLSGFAIEPDDGQKTGGSG